VAIWFWLIIINLMVAGGFYDNALRDLGLSLGAVALACLAAGFLRARPGRPPARSPVTTACTSP